MPIISPLPYTFTNGTIADATQVDADFAQVLANVNANAAENGANSSITSLTGLTTPLTVAQGGTGLATLAAGVPLVGAGIGPIAVTGLTKLTNSIAVNLALNPSPNYFDGPSVAQGTSGIFFASGTVTLQDSGGGGAVFDCKLWDGTTIISSAATQSQGSGVVSLSLSGYIANPAGNIRIAVSDQTSNAGIIVANSTGNGKDSTITVIRIG